MKKIFLFVAVVSAILLTSCKKDRVCTCTTTSTKPGSTAEVEKVTYLESSKKNASLFCTGTVEERPDYSSSSSTGTKYTYTKKCELK